MRQVSIAALGVLEKDGWSTECLDAYQFALTDTVLHPDALARHQIPMSLLNHLLDNAVSDLTENVNIISNIGGSGSGGDSDDANDDSNTNNPDSKTAPWIVASVLEPYLRVVAECQDPRVVDKVLNVVVAACVHRGTYIRVVVAEW